jgi:hypothetical protein
MKSIWITYAWDDNKDGDVDFVAQELIRKGLDVKLDRWNLTAGKRLWEQIESHIQDPSKSDGWLLYATQNSLGSEACKEEFAYALDRALHTRGGEFPVIALFPAPVDRELIPASINIRLSVSITDPDWKERILASVEQRQPDITKPEIDPYDLTIHNFSAEQHAIEVRPRAGTWAPFIAGIPINERDSVSPRLHHGASKRPPIGSFTTILYSSREGTSADNDFWIMSAANEATPTQSYYIICNKLPSLLIFGVEGGQPQYQVKIQS